MPKDKSSGKKLADMMYGNPEGAAFGVFPQMKSKRSRQDPEAAKNFPVDLARGVIAGAVGMPGDIESLARLPYELMTGNESPTILPTSEDVLKRIPFGSDTPASQFASGLGTLAGGSANIGAAPRMVKKGALAAARAGERMAEKVVPGIMERGGAGADILSGLAQGSRSQVIKPKGGNWLTGDVEARVGKMKMSDKMTPEWYADRQRLLKEAESKGDERQARAIKQDIEVGRRNDAINDWIDRNLTNYIKKEMATPEDPVRKLAEQGITHKSDLDDFRRTPGRTLTMKREAAGFPTEGLGQSELARVWENLADYSFMSKPAKDVSAERYPWVTKLDPETPVYGGVKQDMNENLGFDHIVDVLRQDVREGRIRPEQLSKVSMEQAVRRTYEYDQEMAKRMREAALKQQEGFPTYKEYPEGYRWIELAAPDYNKLPIEERKQIIERLRGEAREKGVSPEDYIEKYPESILSQALKYEGDTMGHCVGGYCPDVMQGRSRIFSLRDAKGEPHVTVEVQPSRKNVDPLEFYQSKNVPQSLLDKITEGEKSGMFDDIGALDDFIKTSPEYREYLQAGPPNIVQIKGKQNRAPKDEYLPFVQDFVKSGQWSDVGDLQNTGLIRHGSGKFISKAEMDALSRKHFGESIGNRPDANESPEQYFQRVSRYDPQYLSDTDRAFIEDWKAGNFPSSEDGMARGGRVHISDNPDVMALELAGGGAIHMQTGGVPGLIGRGIKAASKALKPAKEKELALPPVLPRAPAKKKEEIRPYAQRMAQQMTGEFYRPNPKKSENVAGKSFSQFKMEKGLEHDIRPTREVVEPEVADIEKQLGMLKIGISGDTTIADKILHRAGPYELFDPSPQHGGPRYGLGGEGAWASNNPIAATVQKRINELSEAYGAPPLGQYMAMGPQGSNFAQHFADANLQAIDISAMTKSQIEQINRLIREGSEKSGPRPSFPGIEDKGSAYLHFAIDPELRKHFNDLMQKTSITEKLNLPDGRIILHAITEPELRDKEILNTGFSQMRLRSAFDPENLEASVHPTYSHVIPHEEGSALTRTKYLVPGELEFSDVLDYAKRHYRPRDMTRVFQTSTPRQIVDPQHIDEMKLYEELMKEYTGRKKGGAVHKAAGGEITADDLILEERKL